MAATRTATWEKPGPGTWERDASHCGPAPTRVQQALYQEAMGKGTAEGFALFGAPLAGMELRWVHGKFYRRLVPLVGGSRDLPSPPAGAVWAMTRLHPAFRRRERLARRTLAEKSWRQDLSRWDGEWKPSIIATNERFTAVEVHELSDGGLADHLEEVWAHLRSTTTLHFRLHASDLGPMGLLMVRLEDWGLRRDDTFRALVAASPATRAPRAQLRSIARALEAAGRDVAALRTLDDVRAASEGAAAALDAYLATNGWRLTTGYDLEDRCLAELPDVVLTSIRGAAAADRVDGGAHDDDDDDADAERRGADAIAALRGEVPAEHRGEFDDLVEDARRSYGLRDENGPLTYEWPAGLLRRALLDAGRRLASSGRLGAEGDVFELTIEEVAARLAGRPGGPTPGEVADRAEERRWWATLDGPALLGREEAAPPVAAMPPGLALVTRLVLTVVGSLEAAPAAEALTGTGVGEGCHVGTARVVRDAGEAIDTMAPGDVVVAANTAPTYNALLAMAGAVVTEEGGLLCHAAVIAREYGLPAVVGAAGALTAIPDGALVEVDAAAGRVRVLPASEPAPAPVG